MKRLNNGKETGMKALIHDGAGSLSLVDRPKPELMLSTDAIIKVTRSTICTSDLHILKGGGTACAS